MTMQERTLTQGHEMQVNVQDVLDYLTTRIAQLETEKAVMAAQIKQLQAGKGAS